MQALAFGELAKLHGLKGRILPTPRELSESCSVCWREPLESLDLLRELISSGVKYKLFLEEFEIKY